MRLDLIGCASPGHLVDDDDAGTALFRDHVTVGTVLIIDRALPTLLSTYLACRLTPGQGPLP